MTSMSIMLIGRVRGWRKPLRRQPAWHMAVEVMHEVLLINTYPHLFKCADHINR